jgi:uncharacterized protein (UPF0147 family)
MTTEFEQVMILLSKLSEDKMVPRNIKETATKAIEILKDTDLDKEVMVDKVIQLLDEISNDPNMPIFARTQIWNIVSLLESQ